MNYNDIKALIYTHHPSVPVYAQDGHFARLISVDEVSGERQLVRFSRTLQWVRRLETSVRLMAGDRVVNEDNGSWMDGPFGLALGHGLQAALAKTQELGLVPDSTLRVELLLQVTDTPSLELTADLGLESYATRHETRPQKLAVPRSTWLWDTSALEACMQTLQRPIEERLAVTWPWVEGVHPLETGVVWSSDQSSIETDLDMEAWFAQWRSVLAPREVVIPEGLFWRPA